MNKARPRPKWDDPEESKRFIETAEKADATDEKALERAFKKIASSVKSKPSKRN